MDRVQKLSAAWICRNKALICSSAAECWRDACSLHVVCVVDRMTDVIADGFAGVIPDRMADGIADEIADGIADGTADRI